MRRNRDDAGNYTETVSLDDVLGVFGTVEGPVVTSGDVAEALDCSRETARRKLRALESEGRIASRKTGGRVLWWLTDAETEPRDVDPGDPLFTGGAIFASGDSIEEDDIDDVLYGDAEG